MGRFSIFLSFSWRISYFWSAGKEIRSLAQSGQKWEAAKDLHFKTGFFRDTLYIFFCVWIYLLLKMKLRINGYWALWKLSITKIEYCGSRVSWKFNVAEIDYFRNWIPRTSKIITIEYFGNNISWKLSIAKIEFCGIWALQKLSITKIEFCGSRVSQQLCTAEGTPKFRTPLETLETVLPWQTGMEDHETQGRKQGGGAYLVVHQPKTKWKIKKFTWRLVYFGSSFENLCQ